MSMLFSAIFDSVLLLDLVITARTFFGSFDTTPAAMTFWSGALGGPNIIDMEQFARCSGTASAALVVLAMRGEAPGTESRLSMLGKPWLAGPASLRLRAAGDGKMLHDLSAPRIGAIVMPLGWLAVFGAVVDVKNRPSEVWSGAVPPLFVEAAVAGF